MQILGKVALHAESVDRNIFMVAQAEESCVALHAESVDRNLLIR